MIREIDEPNEVAGRPRTMWFASIAESAEIDLQRHAVSTRSFKKPPGAKPIEVSFKPGGGGSPSAAGEVR